VEALDGLGIRGQFRTRLHRERTNKIVVNV
jgi:hypothetical protein